MSNEVDTYVNSFIRDAKIFISEYMSGGRVLMCPESLLFHPDDIDKKIACI